MSLMKVLGWIIQVSACTLVTELEHGAVLSAQHPQCPPSSLLGTRQGGGTGERNP